MTEPICPLCGGPGSYLGQLGKLHWFRCRDCGWEWGQKARAFAMSVRRLLSA